MTMTSPAEFYCVTKNHIVVLICDQKSVTLAFLWEKLSQRQLYKNLTGETTFLKSGLGSSSIIWEWH